jgi:signal transduction histidine kinase
MALLLYRLRVHQVPRLLNGRFEERLAERVRVAQELHDTLLQGVLSASMQLPCCRRRFARGVTNEAASESYSATDGTVVEEGRNTLRGLRSSIGAANDLQNSFS